MEMMMMSNNSSQSVIESPSVNDRVLDCFAREICSKCDQNLIRIGNSLYVLHSQLTCIKIEKNPDEQDKSYFSEEASKSFYLEDESKGEHLQKDAELSKHFKQSPGTEVIEEKNSVDSKSNNSRSKTKSKTNINRIKKDVQINKPKSQENLFECDVCCQKIKTKISLKKHRIRMHSSPGTIFCNICAEIFSTEDCLMKHKSDCILRRRQRLYKCDFEGCKEFYKHRAAHYLAKHSERQFECDICKATFKSKLQIRLHIMGLHDPNGKRFKCKLCDKTFVKKSLVTRHQEQTHLKIRNFMCSECGKSFISKYQLNLHNYQHTGEKPHACSHEGCGKRFPKKGQLTEHMRIHTGIKPYYCSIDSCDRRFAYRIDLKRHKFSAHGIFTQNFPCQICLQNFPETALLKRHMRKHKIQY